ncbi:MAG TPA: cell division protein SepF [Thermoplasmata archaeon]|nr:cell division protein SepF [Thermoplasmata archaeon]
MAFIKKPLKKLVEGGSAAESDAYIDLGELTFEDDQPLGVNADHWVRVAEIYRYEDLGDLTTHVYNGDFLLVDYTSLANDELALKRITADLKNVARDTGGDVAAIGKNWILATPAGVKIDRNKIRGNL